MWPKNNKNEHMKAIILEQAGNVKNLKLAEIPKPGFQRDEVLIKVKAISINPVDIKTRIGKSLYDELKSRNPSIILGWDVSGIVADVGSAVTQFKTGDEVFGMINFPGHGRAYAEYVAAPASHLAIKPSNVSHESAAAATLAAMTAWQALVSHAKVKKGQKVLIHAAAGGVGHYAVQIAKHLGAYVIGTSSAANKDFVLSLGADEQIDYKSQRLEDAVKDVDFVLDSIGELTIDSSVGVTKKGGTVIFLPSGISEEKLEKLRNSGVNCYRILVESNGDDMKQIAVLLENGIIKSHISQLFPFEKMADAHLQIETGRTIGKIVLTI
jgi:NADPH:quinone reductase-like Zn-dependent oxidoreductase